MKIAGIVAEFNPFHYGHKYLIEKIKNDYNMDIVITAMSPNFVMRGEVAIFNKFERTKHALMNGIDMVVEIPTIYAVENATVFSCRAIELLNDLGITDLFFGVECDNQDIFDRIIKASKTIEYEKNFKEYLDNGDSFNTASKKSLLDIDEEFASILSSPNNILAIEYLKAIEIINPNIKPHFIKRVDTSYFDPVKEGTFIQSASAIRELINNGLEYEKYLPYDVKNIVHIMEKDVFEIIKYKIVSLSKKELTSIKGITEGFEGKLKSIKEFTTYENLIAVLTSKRNRETKIKRILIYLLLNIKKDEVSSSKLPYVRILGFNKTGQDYLKVFKNDDVEIFTSIKKSEYASLNRELDFTNIYSLISKEDIYKKEFSPVRLNWFS